MVIINPLLELGIHLEWESRVLKLIIPLGKRAADKCHKEYLKFVYVKDVIP